MEQISLSDCNLSDMGGLFSHEAQQDASGLLGFSVPYRAMKLSEIGEGASLELELPPTYRLTNKPSSVRY